MKHALQGQIKLSQLQILIATSETGSFSEAALSLGMSQSAVSHAISTLEESLGVVLFSRGRHGAKLSPVGQRILSHAQTMMRAATEIEKEANLAKGVEEGQVRVATFRSLATHILPRAIAQLHQRFPGITLHLLELDSCFEVEQALKEGRVDLGLTILPVGESLTVWELFSDEFVVLLPPQVKIEAESLSWSELVMQPLIMPPVNDSMMRPVYHHINSRGHRLNVVNQIETDAMIVSLVSQGVGGTILPRLAAEPIPDSIQIYSLPVPLMRRIGIAMLANALQPPAVYALLDILKDLKPLKTDPVKPK